MEVAIVRTIEVRVNLSEFKMSGRGRREWDSRVSVMEKEQVYERYG